METKEKKLVVVRKNEILEQVREARAGIGNGCESGSGKGCGQNNE